MKTTTSKIKLTFTEPTLATSPGNKEIYGEFIAKRAADDKSPTATADTAAAKADEETATLPVEEQLEKLSTVFPRDEKGLFAFDYQLRGFFKEAIFAMIELGDGPTGLSKWSYKRAVDTYLFVNPRRCYYQDGAGASIMAPSGKLERPLRASTMQGDRIALARSEMLPEGTVLSFEVVLLSPESVQKKSSAVLTPELVRSCLEYGKLKGFSQWRSAGYGRFNFEME